MPRIIFMGTPDFAVPVLNMLLEENYNVIGVVTQPDRPKGRKKTITAPPVKEIAQKHNIPIFQPKKLRGSQELLDIIALQPDIVVTAAYGQILPKEILEAPKHGCINVHASLLPKYRGGAPIHRAIIAGEKETGITIMYMVQALDAGDMIAQRSIPIAHDDTAGSMFEKLRRLGAVLLKEVLPLILKGNVSAEAQDESQVTFAYNISREDEKIDWHKTATQIYNHVRGLNPWPVAYTMWRGEPFKIWEAEALEDETIVAPGTILALEKEGIIVAAQTGKVMLKMIQPSGKKPISVKEFLHGCQMKVGERLGEE